jgi:transposase
MTPVRGCRHAANVAASLCYLPYSPDFNPIEKLFAKLKALLRRAAPRTVNTLWDHIGKLLDPFSSDECHNYFISSEHVSS